MKRLLVLLLCPLLAFAEPVTIDLQAVPMKDLIRLVYGELLGVSYVIDGSVADDLKPVSLRLEKVEPKRVEWVLRDVLKGQGVTVDTSAGVVFVRKAGTVPEPTEWMVYKPKYRSVRYLQDLTQALFPQGAFGTQRGGAMPINAIAGNATGPNGTMGNGSLAGTVRAIDQGANRQLDTDADVMIFRGNEKDIERLNKLLVQLDTPSGEVMVKAVIYEVQTTAHEGTAVDLAVSILSGKLGIKLAGGAADVSNVFAKLTGSLDLTGMYSALSSDGRFKVVSAPRVRVRSGASAHFAVGDETPILGSVSYDTNGKAVQSVTYKSSGVLFDLKPQVREGGVDVHLSQQISSFAKTETGVNGSPTLNKRELSTDLTVADDEIVVIGGLESDRNTESSSGLSFLPAFFRSNASDTTRSEILLMLHVQRI